VPAGSVTNQRRLGLPSHGIGAHHGTRQFCDTSRALEQSQARRSEGTVQAQGDLGDSRTAATVRARTGARPVRPVLVQIIGSVSLYDSVMWNRDGQVAEH